MSDYSMTPNEIYSKIDWEGGAWETICGYGLSHEVLPDNTPTEVVDAWKRVEATRDDVYSIITWLEDNQDESI